MPTGYPDDVVFEWLSEGLSPSPPVYVSLLNLGGGARRDQILANLRTVAERLRERPAYWGELIRARDWRYTLIGSSAVLLTRNPQFLGDLLSRFQGGSWVAPQLAVALGLVHPAEASGDLAAVMRGQGNRNDPKSVFSAYAVLKLLGCPGVEEFEASDDFRRTQTESPGTSMLDRNGFLAVAIVHHQWTFWNDPATLLTLQAS